MATDLRFSSGTDELVRSRATEMTGPTNFPPSWRRLALPIRTAILDGEVIVPGKRGFSDFHKLQEDLARGESDRFLYYAFDLLYLDGMDLRAAPLIARKHALESLISERSLPIIYSDHLDSEADLVQRRACELGYEGVVSKRRDAPYRSGEQDTWITCRPPSRLR